MKVILVLGGYPMTMILNRPPNLGLLGRTAELAQAPLKTLVTCLFLNCPLLACSAVWACSFDVDCEVGSKCINDSGSIEGVCMGGCFRGIRMTASLFTTLSTQMARWGTHARLVLIV